MGRKSHHGPQLSISACNVKLEKTAKTLAVKPSEYWAFDLRAGITCRFAKKCRSAVINGKIKDGPHTEFRCYAASCESRLPCVYKLRQRNTQAIKAIIKKGIRYRRLADILETNLPPKCKVLRLHTSGDFSTYTYLQAWLEVAKRHPSCLFYFYTKALPLIERYVQTHPEGVDLARGILASNVRVTASYGGTHDHLIEGLKIRSARVIMGEDDTNLPIDIDDTHAARSGGNFAILIHGTQPAGSESAKVWDKIRRTHGNYAPKKGGN